MVEWYYLLPAFAAGLEVGRAVVYREWRKERETEFDRQMAWLRAQEAERAQKGAK